MSDKRRVRSGPLEALCRRAQGGLKYLYMQAGDKDTDSLLRRLMELCPRLRHVELNSRVKLSTLHQLSSTAPCLKVLVLHADCPVRIDHLGRLVAAMHGLSKIDIRCIDDAAAHILAPGPVRFSGHVEELLIGGGRIAPGSARWFARLEPQASSSTTTITTTTTTSSSSSSSSPPPPRLRKLSLFNYGHGGAGVVDLRQLNWRLAPFGALEQLVLLASSGYTIASLPARLRSLCLTHADIALPPAAHLAHLTHLTHLSADNSAALDPARLCALLLSSASLSLGASLQQQQLQHGVDGGSGGAGGGLRTLTLNYSPYAAAVRHVLVDACRAGCLTQLRELGVAGIAGVDDACLAALGHGAPLLEGLDARDTKITGVGIAALLRVKGKGAAAAAAAVKSEAVTGPGQKQPEQEVKEDDCLCDSATCYTAPLPPSRLVWVNLVRCDRVSYDAVELLRSRDVQVTYQYYDRRRDGRTVRFE